MVTFEEVKKAIDPVVGKLKVVNVSNTGTKIGETVTVNDGIVIYRTGTVKINNVSTNLVIRLEGGKAGYKDAITSQHVYATYTRAQYTILGSIINYISAMNPNTTIEQNL